MTETPSQTAGPYVHIGLAPNALGISGVFSRDLPQSPVAAGAAGTPITVVGTVRDGAGMILRDVVIECWQADSGGIYPDNDPRGPADPHVHGWARIPTDPETGQWQLQTIKPGQVPFSDGRLMAPHINLWIVARGINTGLQTRIYFDDEPRANDACPVLARIEHRARVDTLLARTGEPGQYRFDIVLQGERETVFFDI